MILRCTAKLRAVVGGPDPDTESLPADANDWYANLLWIERRKCLLVTHAGTLFSVFAPDVRAGQLRPLGRFLVPRISEQLAAEKVAPNVLGVLEDPCPVRIAKTVDRSVLGAMNDLAVLCERSVAGDGGLARLDRAALHRRLQRNLCSARRYVPAVELATGARPSVAELLDCHRTTGRRGTG